MVNHQIVFCFCQAHKERFAIELDATANVWLSGSGGDCKTTTANPLLTLQIAPAFASGEAAVRCSCG
jgi:hypothetical protein